MMNSSAGAARLFVAVLLLATALSPTNAFAPSVPVTFRTCATAPRSRMMPLMAQVDEAEAPHSPSAGGRQPAEQTPPGSNKKSTRRAPIGASNPFAFDIRSGPVTAVLQIILAVQMINIVNAIIQRHLNDAPLF
ncbi:hypothetical protein JKP88DRAFT_242842 [Tribonema minus]|uniref:Uncharacterized protein n=1 Tax=Tribonema minus TaxID=303371 RepID=A0A835ZL77_9STRA|nr:hypothetical protein JKP88DRAFT_242842 [Tribonema minus]